MKDEVTRIMKLVQDGKLSPEDAAELIDAMQTQTPPTPPTPPPTQDEAAPTGEGEDAKSKDPVKSFVDFVEGIGRDVSTNVNWNEIGQQIRQSVQQGADALKKAAEEIKAGNVNFFGSIESREITLPISVGEGKRLVIENTAGSVNVVAGAAEGRVVAKAKIRGGTPEEAKQRADAFNFMVEESDHQVTIRQPRNSHAAVDLDIQLAHGCPVEIRTESGSMHVENTGHGGKFVAMSGEIALKGLNGPIDVTCQSGDIAIEACETPSLSIEVKSGDLSLTDVKGAVSARLASGDLSIKRWSGQALSVESVSGDVAVDLTEPVTGSVNIRTVNGDTSLALADGGDCRVSLSTLRGAVACALTLADEAKGEQRVTGRLGAGTGTLDVSGINGDISVKLRDAGA